MGIPLWEATRATSLFITSSYGAVQATAGSGNSYDVKSAAPDTTTVMSFCPGSVAAGNDKLIWQKWQTPQFAPDSWYDFGIRIACKSMGTSYLAFEWSDNGGGAWNSLITSVGGSNLGATTIVRSLAANISVASLWIRANQTNTHRRSRCQLWDVYLVGSYLTTEAHSRVLTEGLGLFDCGAEEIYSDDFNRADGSPGSNWQIYADCKSMDITNNLLKRASTDEPGLFWTTTPNRDQYCRVGIGSLWEIAVRTRMQFSAASLRNCYEWAVYSYVPGPTGEFRVLSESNVTIVYSVGLPGLLAGQTIWMTAVGSRITCYWDNTPVYETTNTLFSDGMIGLGGSGGNSRWDNFEGGNYSYLFYSLTAGGEAFVRVISDALGLTDATRIGMALARYVSDIGGMTDSAGRTMGYGRKIADTSGMTDALWRKVDWRRYFSEALGTTDQAPRAVVHDRDVADALGLTDTSAALKLLTRVLTEQLGLTDAQARAIALFRNLTESLGLTDAQARASALARNLTESLGLNDAQARAVAYSRRMTDALGMGDAVGALKLLTRYLSENLGLADTIKRQVALGRVVTESVGLTDDRRKASGIQRILADVAGLSDASLRQVSFIRALTEALGTTDALMVQKIISRAIADALGFTDYRDVRNEAPVLLRTIADSLSIADAITVSKWTVIIRTISEALGITDSRRAAQGVRRILSEQLGLTDFEDETKQIRRYLSELVTLADNQERAALIIRRMVETAGMTDAAAGALATKITRLISDTLGLTDGISRLAALLTWLALTIIAEIPAVDSDLAEPAVMSTVEKVIHDEAEGATAESVVHPPAAKTEVE